MVWTQEADPVVPLAFSWGTLGFLVFTMIEASDMLANAPVLISWTYLSPTLAWCVGIQESPDHTGLGIARSQSTSGVWDGRGADRAVSAGNIDTRCGLDIGPRHGCLC